jgi:hypothetical protein
MHVWGAFMCASLSCTATKLVYLHPRNTTVNQKFCDIDHEGKLHFVNLYLDMIILEERISHSLSSDEACIHHSAYVNTHSDSDLHKIAC